MADFRTAHVYPTSLTENIYRIVLTVEHGAKANTIVSLCILLDDCTARSYFPLVIGIRQMIFVIYKI